ncbi:MAG: uracil-DNA glycosylase [Verrucomicrobiota bacterium]
MTGRDPQQELLDVLNNVARYVRHQQEEGVDAIEVYPAKRGAGPAVREAEAGLREIAARVAQCTRCALSKSRTRTVPGQGSSSPEVLFVGEGPGYDEDRQGLAFVGRAGQLLTKIIEAMGFTRDQVFIGNIVKCRPPENRTPYPDEMQACLPYLKEQIALLKPKVIVALGATAVRGLLEVETGITRLRGQWLSYEGIDLMPTYHPAYLLRNPAGKKDVWEDMKAVLARLGRQPPSRKK